MLEGVSPSPRQVQSEPCPLSPASVTCGHFRLDITASRARNDHFIRHSLVLNRRALKSSSWLRFSCPASEEAFLFPAPQTSRKGQSLSCLAQFDFSCWDGTVTALKQPGVCGTEPDLLLGLSQGVWRYR